ncbi:hypothetical protein M5K25_014384 [Dendrobium thyrsiflorum]|uniref:RRM domain-containing protein n=1 Tax=Dendrobium thyrsiflorum TaxID=117978 RepID=A0ABD0V2R6_DENTH
MGLKFIIFEDIQVLKNFKSSLTLKSAREPRGFGFIQYVDPADAAEAKYQMDGQILLGRELTVVYAEENRKKPADMRARERVSRSYGHRRSPRFTRSPHYSRSRSPAPARHSSRYSRSPRHAKSRSRSPIYHSPSPSPKRVRQHSRSVSPEERQTRRERSYSRSPYGAGSRSRSPIEDDDAGDYARKSSHRERSRSYSQ